MNPKKNVIIVSARRSGTHLLTDLIVNNFGYESIKYNYIDYTKFTGQPEYPTSELDKLESAMNEGGKVTWTHLHDYKDYHKYNHSSTDQSRLDKMFSESKVILIYRDIRDIINSCYHRPKIKNKYKSFSDFYDNFNFDGYELIDQKYDNMSDLLIQYYKNWFSVYMSKEVIGIDMEVISFEEIIQAYDSSVAKIGKFIEQPISNKYFRRNQIVDVRLPNKNTENIIYTTNDFRNGKINDWFSTMENEFGTELGEKYYIDLGIGFDYFLNDKQIHKYHRPQRNEFYKPIPLNVEKDLDDKLKQYENKFKPFNVDIESRYTESTQRSTDFRYYHKVFYYDEYVLKFIYPCKAALDKKTFNSSVPIVSKQLLLTILQTDEILYKNGIVPKLYYAGIYEGVLFVVQEKCKKENVICEKYNIYPQVNDWWWPVALDIHHKLLSHFNTALEYNILLTDIINVYNSAIDESGNLKYFDLDGIKYYESKEEMIKSEDYKNIMGIFSEVEKYC